MKIGKKLKEDHTSNEFTIKGTSEEETQFYGIFVFMNLFFAYNF